MSGIIAGSRSNQEVKQVINDILIGDAADEGGAER
jgi:hypothetical protein